MSVVTINLTPEQDSVLTENAKRNGKSIEQYILDAALSGEPAVTTTAESQSRPKTGREIIERLQAQGALFRTDMTEDSVDYVNRMRAAAEKRDWS